MIRSVGGHEQTGTNVWGFLAAPFAKGRTAWGGERDKRGKKAFLKSAKSQSIRLGSVGI